MEHDYEKNGYVSLLNPVKQQKGEPEKIPMHPDDFNALHAWITAKRFHEAGIEKSFAERPVFYHMLG